jgi:hypothetical protein
MNGEIEACAVQYPGQSFFRVSVGKIVSADKAYQMQHQHSSRQDQKNPSTMNTLRVEAAL